MDSTGVSPHTPDGTHADPTVRIPKHSLGGQMWHFVRHYLEMCAAMCIGGLILNILVFDLGPRLIGYPDLRELAPRIALVVAALLFTLPMATWMRIRGMAWRPTIEMSGATVGAAIVVVALSGAGLISPSGLQAWLEASCAPWCAVMFVAMLFRLPLYTGPNGHQMEPQAQTQPM